MRLRACLAVVALATGCAAESSAGGAASRPTPTRPAVQVATHDGHSGAMFAGLSGVRLGKRDIGEALCVVLLDGSGTVRGVSFPRGYTATDGPLEVHDAAGRVVMREGLVFGLAGGSNGAAPGTACVPEGGTVWETTGLTPLDELPSPWPQATSG